MITITAPIELTEANQPLFPLAWKAKNLGADSYIYSDTHVAYDIKEQHIGMIDTQTLEGIIAAGGDAINFPLWIEVDPTAEVDAVFFTPAEGEDAPTWADWKASINHTIDEPDGKAYTMAHNGSEYFPASVVIGSELNWITGAEYRELFTSNIED